MVYRLAVHDDLRGLAAVKVIGLLHTLGIDKACKLVDGRAGTRVGRVIDGHEEVVQLVGHTDAGTGILGVYLADGVALAVLQLAVVNEHGAEGDSKDNVVILNEFLRLALAGEFARAGEEHVAGGGEEAGVDLGGAVAVERTLVHGDAEISEGVEVAVYRDDGVRLLCHIRGVELDAGAVAVLGKFAPQLRAVRDLDLSAGAAALIDVFFPSDDEDGVVKVVPDRFAGDEVCVLIEDDGLSVEQVGGVLYDLADIGGVICCAEVCRVWHGRDSVVLLQGVYLLYVCKLAEGVACGVVDIYVQLVGQAETAAAGGIGERTGGGVDVEERPQQYKRREQTEEQRDDPRARRVIPLLRGGRGAHGSAHRHRLPHRTRGCGQIPAPPEVSVPIRLLLLHFRLDDRLRRGLLRGGGSGRGFLLRGGAAEFREYRIKIVHTVEIVVHVCPSFQ